MSNAKKFFLILGLVVIAVCITVMIFLITKSDRGEESTGEGIIKETTAEGAVEIDVETLGDEEGAVPVSSLEDDKKADDVSCEEKETDSEDENTILLDFTNDTLVMSLPEGMLEELIIEQDGSSYIVYSQKLREGFRSEDGTSVGGVLFTVRYCEGAMTNEQLEESDVGCAAYRYLFATDNNTYYVQYPTDVQHNAEDAEQQELYNQLTGEIENIQFDVK